MHKKYRYRETFYFFYILIDILCMFTSLYGSLYFLNKSSQIPPSIHVGYILWGLILLFYLYKNRLLNTRRELILPQECGLVCKAVSMSTVILCAIFFFGGVSIFPRIVIVVNFLCLCFFLSLWRIIKRIILRIMVTKGYDNNNVLIIGAGSMGEELSEQIKQRTFLGRNIRGFLDDYVPPGVFVNGYEVLGTVVDLKGCIRRYFIDEVFITIPSEREKTKVIIQQCKEMNVSVKIVPEQFDSQEDILFSGHIGYLCVLEHLQQRVKKPESVRKRLIDVFLSLVGLILCAPLFLVIALAIKLSSSGPVIHISKRCGRKGNPFIFYKFRTMVIDAEKMRDELSDKNEAGGCLFKIKEDPRVTNVGKFLRRYSLDELPQLLNVLRGEMSIVGPRPLPFKDINPDDLAQLKRLEIRPGITGLWQVHGRSDASFKRLLRWDMWYVKNWSLGLDMVILLKTVRAVLSGRGAY